MPRKCPNCKTELRDDGVVGWCVSDPCPFRGYVVLKTGKVLERDDDFAYLGPCVGCNNPFAPHDTFSGPMCSQCLAQC